LEIDVILGNFQLLEGMTHKQRQEFCQEAMRPLLSNGTLY
jgi:hypothetical protein